MESVVRGHVARCFSRLWQGWLTHVEDVAFFLRVVGSHWCIESRGVTGSDFSFKASLQLLRGEWPVGGKGEAGDGVEPPVRVPGPSEGGGSSAVCRRSSRT